MHAKETKEVERRGVDLVHGPRARARPQARRAGVQQPGLRHPLDRRQRRHLPHRGQGPHRRRQGLLRHPQRGDDRQERRPALPTRSRHASTRAEPSTTRSATSTTPSPPPTSATSRPPASAATGPRPGPREDAVLMGGAKGTTLLAVLSESTTHRRAANAGQSGAGSRDSLASGKSRSPICFRYLHAATGEIDRPRIVQRTGGQPPGASARRRISG